MLRAVLDANVFASAKINPTGAAGRVLERFLAEGAYRLILSPPIVAEIRQCLLCPRVRDRSGLSPEEVDRWLGFLLNIVELVAAPALPAPVCRDPDDDRYLAAAAAGRADHVVSSDKDLLDVGSYEGIPIVRPREFLKILAHGRRLGSD